MGDVMSKETENQKDVKLTLGDLRKTLAISQREGEAFREILKSITEERKEKVTIRYDDIDEEITFIVKPMTVKIEMETEIFKTKMERDRHIISRLVTTEDGRPISYAEIDMMPLGMMEVLTKTIEQLSFFHKVGREKLDD